MSVPEQPPPNLLECMLSVEIKMQIVIYGISIVSLWVGFNWHLVLSQNTESTDFVTTTKNSSNNYSSSGEVDSDNSSTTSTYFRLSKSIISSHYSLQVIHVLTTENNSDATQFYNPGNVSIFIEVLHEVDNITLHAEDMQILDVKVTNASYFDIPLKERRMENETQFLVLNLHNPILSGQYTINISFIARIADDRLNGLYLDYYLDPVTGIKKYLATTLFAPNHARKAFPCFDEPGLRATFEISIGHPQNYIALSNTPSTNSSGIPVEGYPDYVWTFFHKTPPMPTYIVAMITCDFENQTESDGRVELQMYAPSHLLRYSTNLSTNFAMQMTEKVMPWMESEFGQEYPLSKLDAVSLPHFYFSAMENWGLLTFKDPVLLTMPNVTTDKERARVAEVLAHELAHQTFGNLITISWWDNVWLKEGFSTFYSDVAVEAVHPEFHTLTHFVTHNVQVALNFDAGLDTHPLYNPLNSSAAIGDIYTRIPYKKGASILRMTEAFMKPELFRSGVKLFVDQMKYKAAAQDDLFAALETVEADQKRPTSHNATIGEILRSWTNQSGFPLIRVFIQSERILRITQEKFVNPHVSFLLNQESNRTNENSTWLIPITFWPQTPSTDNNDSTVNVGEIWLRQSEIFVDYPHLKIPFFVNPDAKGYYRVMYDPEIFDNIQQQLSTNHSAIFPVTKSQLIDDYFALSFAKYVHISAALNLTRYLENERSLVVWSSVIANFNRIYNRIRDTKYLSKFQEYTLSKLVPAWNASLCDLENDLEVDDITEKKRLHSLLLDHICLYKPSQCAQLSTDKMNSWKNYKKLIPPNEQNTLFCAFVATSVNLTQGTERSDFFLDLYHNESFSVMKGRYLKAMSCATHTSLISRLLNWTTKPELHDVDRVQIIKFVAESTMGKTLVLPFLRQHFSSLYKNASVANPVVEGFKALVPYFTTARELQEVITFEHLYIFAYNLQNTNFIILHTQMEEFIIRFGEKLGPGKRKTLQKEVTKVKLNMLWTKEIGPDVESWLQMEPVKLND